MRNIFYTSKRNELFNKLSCFYYACKGHAPNTYYMRIFGVPSESMFGLRNKLNKKVEKSF